MRTKRNLTLILFATCSLFYDPCFGQVEPVDKKNLLKLNVLGLATGKFGLAYERMLSNRFSIGADISLSPEKKLPFRSKIKDIVDYADLNQVIDGLESNSFSVSPEVRYYLSGGTPGKGFYVGTFVKYARFSPHFPLDVDVQVDYEGQTVYRRKETISFSGDYDTFSYGLAVGCQFQLARSFFLDWRILGPAYGSGSGGFDGDILLNTDEQTVVRDHLSEIRQELLDLPLQIDTDFEVDHNGVEAKVNKSPWADVRMGVSIVYQL